MRISNSFETRTDFIQFVILCLFTVFVIRDGVNTWKELSISISDLDIAFTQNCINGFFFNVITFILSIVLINMVYVDNTLCKLLIIFNLSMMQMITTYWMIFDHVVRDDTILLNSGLFMAIVNSFMMFMTGMLGFMNYFTSNHTYIQMILGVVGLFYCIFIGIQLRKLWENSKRIIIFSIISLVVEYVLLYAIFVTNVVSTSITFKTIMFITIFFLTNYFILKKTKADRYLAERNRLFEDNLGLNDLIENFTLKNMFSKPSNSELIGIIVVVILFIGTIFYGLISNISDVLDLFLGSDINSFGTSNTEEILDVFMIGNETSLQKLMYWTLILFTSLYKRQTT